MTFQRRLQNIIQNKNFPIILLLTISLLIGILTFQDYGMSWDEYLYYKYADAIGYAYSIPAHLSPDFDLDNAYGPSAWDHQNHGPAYLIFARLGVYALHALTNIDQIAIWHLMNFVTFLVGAFFVYKIGLRWLNHPGAMSATLLYLSQPVLWGHAYINPKDTPFATAFIAAVYFGLKMIDIVSTPYANAREKWQNVIITGILIGLATNMRITGPLVGVMIFAYMLLKRQSKALLWLVPTALIALVTTYITWPYIWNSPIATFVEVVRTMSNYPVTPKVLFLGDIYRSNDLPRRYLPWLLGITTTEPVWPLFFSGSVIAIIRFYKKQRNYLASKRITPYGSVVTKQLEWKSLCIVFFWFAFMVSYILITRTPTYDGYRHFLFILPPIFIICGFAFEEIYSRISVKWLYGLLVSVLIMPGIIANIKLHPYQYVYYNSFVGGTSNVAGIYETDYWLTCYKEAVEKFNDYAPDGATLVIHRETPNAAYYAKEGIQVKNYKEKTSGDYLLIGARLNDYQRKNAGYPIALSVGRDGAGFCVIRQVP